MEGKFCPELVNNENEFTSGGEFLIIFVIITRSLFFKHHKFGGTLG